MMTTETPEGEMTWSQFLKAQRQIQNDYFAGRISREEWAEKLSALRSEFRAETGPTVAEALGI